MSPAGQGSAWRELLDEASACEDPMRFQALARTAKPPKFLPSGPHLGRRSLAEGSIIVHEGEPLPSWGGNWERGLVNTRS